MMAGSRDGQAARECESGGGSDGWKGGGRGGEDMNKKYIIM